MPTWSGYWNYVYSDGYKPVGRGMAVRRLIGRALHGYGRKGYNAVLRQLVEGNVGGVAKKDYTRVAVQNTLDPMSLGGKRGTEVRTAINRPTTTGDQAIIIDDLDFDNTPKPWPVDKSGNGGGSKRGL